MCRSTVITNLPTGTKTGADQHVICSNLNLMVPNASLYDFGILTSNVHMAWMRVVAGRLEMRYRYSAQIVYNNFVWPHANEKQKTRINDTARNVLKTRQKFPDASLAVLYDNDLMPPDLRHAHQDNDRAVWEAYGRAWPIVDESACVAHLMKLYQILSSKIGLKEILK